jgi:hypothetical protein
VFTARYGLIPYIKQTRFRLQKINTEENSHGLSLGNFPELPSEAEENHEQSPLLLAELRAEIRNRDFLNQ